MNLSEKIQTLRKEKGLTQEQFADMLYVSRTAVSKWENGRGMPGMDSLKMIAKVFEISIDELLCAEEIITAAENENNRNINSFALKIDAIFNLTAVLSFFLPLYKAEAEGIFYCVPLYSFSGSFYALYWIIPILMFACGIAQLFLCKFDKLKQGECASWLGIALNIAEVFLLILSAQPYPAMGFFALLLIKGYVLLIRREK